MNSPIRRVGFYNTAAAAEHYLGIRWAPEVWRRVLEQAINDAVYGVPQFEVEGLSAEDAARVDADIRGAARDWFADPANEPRRFVWVCEQLDLDPAAVRAAVIRRTVGT